MVLSRHNLSSIMGSGLFFGPVSRHTSLAISVNLSSTSAPRLLTGAALFGRNVRLMSTTTPVQGNTPIRNAVSSSLFYSFLLCHMRLVWSYDTYGCDSTVCSYNMDALHLVGLAPHLEHVQTFTRQQMTRSAVLTTHASAS